MLLDISKLPEMDNGEIISRIGGEMTHFDLCCSTGVIKDLQGHNIQQWQRENFEPGKASKLLQLPPWSSMSNPADNELKSMATHTHNILRQASSLYPWPLDVCAWFAISMMHKKFVSGWDDGGTPGYSGYKVGNFVWFDRVNDEKRSGTRFNSYNTTFSCDHLTDFMYTVKLGEIIASRPQMGAHGAKVRGAIFTPDADALEAYEMSTRKKVYDHIEYCNEILRNSNTIWREYDLTSDCCDYDDEEDEELW